MTEPHKTMQSENPSTGHIPPSTPVEVLVARRCVLVVLGEQDTLVELHPAAVADKLWSAPCSRGPSGKSIVAPTHLRKWAKCSFSTAVVSGSIDVCASSSGRLTNKRNKCSAPYTVLGSNGGVLEFAFAAWALMREVYWPRSKR